jgi:hypothetical protein
MQHNYKTRTEPPRLARLGLLSPAVLLAGGLGVVAQLGFLRVLVWRGRGAVACCVRHGGVAPTYSLLWRGGKKEKHRSLASKISVLARAPLLWRAPGPPLG